MRITEAWTVILQPLPHPPSHPQKAGNAFVMPLVLGVSMDGGDRLPSSITSDKREYKTLNKPLKSLVGSVISDSKSESYVQLIRYRYLYYYCQHDKTIFPERSS